MSKKFLCVSLFIVSLIILAGCGDNEAKKQYELEKQKLEQMKEDNRQKIRQTIATGASEPDVLMLQIECAKQEMLQEEKVEKLAKEAGIGE